jgi:hypothetical protein
VFNEWTLVSPLALVGCTADWCGLCGKRLLRRSGFAVGVSARSAGFGCCGVVGVDAVALRLWQCLRQEIGGALLNGVVRSALVSHHRPSTVGRDRLERCAVSFGRGRVRFVWFASRE